MTDARETPSTMRDLQRMAYATSQSKGWYAGTPDPYDPTWLAARLALIHSEVSEALECVRDGKIATYFEVDRYGNEKPEGLGPELADVVIRVLDLAESLGIDLESEVLRKNAFNRTRKHRHGGRAL